MGVPSDKIMELMRQAPASGGGKTAPAPVPTETDTSDATTAPMSAPMSTPEPKMGNKQGAFVNLSLAMDLIEQALPVLGSESEEGQKALSVLRTMAGIIGPRKGKTQELQQSEIMQMLQNLPQAGGATPEGKAMAAAPAIPNMAPPGAPPGGAPPMPPPGGGGPALPGM